MTDFEIQNLKNKDIADLILKLCMELSVREKRQQEYPLKEARTAWPELHESLRKKGKVVGLNDLAKPVTVAWSDQPMVSLGEYYGKKPKTKARALEIVKKSGCGGWVTMEELWLWLADAGPIMERGMENFGYKFL